MSTVLSSSLEFIPRSFKPKGGGGTTVKIVLKEKHKKETRVKPTDEIVTTRCGKNPNRVLVYMFVPPSSETSKEILRTIAIEKEPAEEVEIYNWKLIKGIFHLIQTKKISKQEFKQEAQNFRLITRTNEGHWNIFRARTSELRMTESPEKETKNL
ncbi:chordin-like protein 2 [Limosa lapponica baueri]|uniref:Chordin-like protein 2 n=1 Tax=Limosa lapponica baueri TaxID=1758121 RepID=A0A2I0TK09_LIMLA|nr:chordin-like protein 2 [Limosa lapponica baueri]